jgi:peptide chain release factor 2
LTEQVTASKAESYPSAYTLYQQQRLAYYQQLQQWQTNWQDLQAAVELLELDLDADLLQEAQTIIARPNRNLGLRKGAKDYHFSLDSRGAILIITASQDEDEHYLWTESVQRMYIRWMEQQGYRVGRSVGDLNYIEGALGGFSTVTLGLFESGVYGRLKTETGRHRLIHCYRRNQGEKAIEATVEVLPLIDVPEEVELSVQELVVETDRSNLNTNRREVWVKITHTPTNIQARCNRERSQRQNKELALLVLRSKLFAIMQEQGVATVEEIQPELINQLMPIVREYRCTKLNGSLPIAGTVKDCRTGVEITDIVALLDGNLDCVINSCIEFSG